MASTDALGTTTIWTYDAVGNRTREAWANGNARVLGYDALERHVTTTDRVGPAARLAAIPLHDND